MRKPSVSNTVLLIICLMYLILYVDRVNISTAAPLIAWLVSLVSWRGAFVVLAVLSLFWVLAWLRYFRDVPTAPPLTVEELAILPARSRSGATELVPWFKLFRRMLPVTAVDFCYG